MILNEIIRFKEKNYFKGSVEIDSIFSDKNYAQQAANSYVFHDDSIFADKNKSLTDTVSFTKEIFQGIFQETKYNPIVTAISGYGSGKSHYAIAIMALFANNKQFLNKEGVIENLNDFSNTNGRIGSELNNLLGNKPNLVIGINGMNDVDITNEIVKQIEYQLEISGYDKNIFSEFEEIYTRAKTYIYNNFETDNFINIMQNIVNEKIYGLKKYPEKEYLIENIKDPDVFKIINTHALRNIGLEFKIINNLNPKTALQFIIQKLCGNNKPFGKLLFVFDEIGRYIEWLPTSTNHSSLMQQLYEAVKNSNGMISLLSFIQFPFQTYLSHLDKTNSLERFVGRLSSSAKNYRLSNALELVFVNLIERKKEYSISSFFNLHKHICQWSKYASNHTIWSIKKNYETLICKRLSPFHPLTILLLTQLSEFTQNRGPIAILRDLIETNKELSIEALGSITPLTVFTTSFYDDIKRMEKEGKIDSNYLNTYDELINRPEISRSISGDQKACLQAIVFINILKLQAVSTEDYFFMLSNITNLEQKVIKKQLSYIENEWGIIRFDEANKMHFFILDSVGRHQYDSFITLLRMRKKTNTQNYVYENIINKLLISHLSDITVISPKTVTTSEWKFKQSICNLSSTKQIIDFIDAYKKNYSVPNVPRGKLFWIIFDPEKDNLNEKDLYSFVSSLNKYKIDNIPVYLGLIVDSNSIIYKYMHNLDVLYNLSPAQKEKYSKFYSSDIKKFEEKLLEAFLKLSGKAKFFINGDFIQIDSSYKKYITEKTKTLFNYVVPFNFDGFNKERIHNARSEYIKILKVFISNEKNLIKVVNTRYGTKTFNRMSILLGNESRSSWNCLEKDGSIKIPRNDNVKIAYKKVNEMILNGIQKINKQLELKPIVSTLNNPPYGMNIYSISLLLVLYFYNNNHLYLFLIDNNAISYHQWVEVLTSDNDIHIDKVENTKIANYNKEKILKDYKELLDTVKKEKTIPEILSINDKILKFKEKIPVHLLESIPITESNEIINRAIKLNKNNENLILALKRTNTNFGSSKVTPENYKPFLELLIQLISVFKELRFELKKYNIYFYENWDLEINKEIDEIKIHIRNYFSKWLNFYSWPYNISLQGYVSYMVEVKNLFQKLSLTKEFHKLTSHLTFIKNNYDKFNQFKKDTEKIILNKDAIQNIEQCNQIIKKIEIKKQELLNFDLPKNLINDYEKTLSDLTIGFEKKKLKYTSEVENIFAIIDSENFSEVDELQEFVHRINIATNTLPDNNKDKKMLEKISSNMSNLLSRINDLYKNPLSPEIAESRIVQIKKDYRVNNKVVDKYYDSFDENLKLKQLFNKLLPDYSKFIQNKVNNWFKNYFISDINQLSQQALKGILKDLEEVPTFFSKEEANKVDILKNEIKKKLDYDIEESIIELFNKIKLEKDKKKLLEKLENLI